MRFINRVWCSRYNLILDGHDRNNIRKWLSWAADTLGIVSKHYLYTDTEYTFKGNVIKQILANLGEDEHDEQPDQCNN